MKLNWQTKSDGTSCRRAGHQRFFSDYLYDDDGVLLSDPSHGAGSHYHNHDHHHQGDTREPITFLYEATSNDGTRRLFDGTQSRISVLNSEDGTWTNVATEKGDAGTRWHAATLQDVVIFTNNYDHPQKLNIASPFSPGSTSDIADLNGLQLSRARVVAEFQGFMILMNVTEDSKNYSSRIRWSDLNLPESWNLEASDTLAGMQDLDYGDEILAAAPMLGSLYVYTRRSIWKMSVSGDTNAVFSFNKVYSEPKNQTGCLAYPDTLVSTGSEHWYMGRDGIYNYNPYIASPERQDWLHRAAGIIYLASNSRLDDAYCPAPVAEYFPTEREIWISWPTAGMSGINNMTFVAQIERKTADVVDTGYTAFVNFRRTPANTNQCNETQDLIGVSGNDWCLKSIGGVFFREFAYLANNAGDRSIDLPEEATYYSNGYNSLLRGLIPSGLFDREKDIRSVTIEHDTRVQTSPCKIVLRIGNSISNVDPNDDSPTCAVLWQPAGTKTLQCPTQTTVSKLKQTGRRSGLPMIFPMLWRGRYLYFELSITAQDGGLAIGGDTAWLSIIFDLFALPKN